jgi:transcriptional regulator with XRE-family HTH domain
MPRAPSVDPAAETRLNQARGLRLQAARKAGGQTRQEIARAVGVSSQAYQKYELGRTAVAYPRLAALADAFGMTVPELLAFDDPLGSDDPGRNRQALEIARLFQRLEGRDQQRLTAIARELSRPRRA